MPESATPIVKKVLGVLSHDHETWHTNTVLGGQYRKTLSFLIGRSVFALRGRKVPESASPFLKSSRGFNRRSRNLAYQHSLRRAVAQNS